MASYPAPYHFPLLHPSVYAGTFVHLRSRTELCVREHAILGVDQYGRIEFIEGHRGEDDILTDDWIEEEVQRQGWGKRKQEHGSEDQQDVIRGEEEVGTGWVLVRAPKGDWWFPGFVGEWKIFFLKLSLVLG